MTSMPTLVLSILFADTDIEVTLTFGEAVGLTNVQAATVNILITDVNGLVADTLALTGAAAVR